MAYTGFGMAQDAQGYTYAAAYACDRSAAGSFAEYVCWPSAGSFPAEFLTDAAPWYISLLEGALDLEASAPRLTLAETTSGAVYEFSFDGVNSRIDTSCAGDGPALIFTPDPAIGYWQNQVWQVRLTGLVRADGSEAEIEYQVEMASLVPIDPYNVELTASAREVRVGDTVQFSALVVPRWADDLAVTWESSDTSVLSVENGVGRAVGAGKATVTATASNGRADKVEIAVSD